MPGPTLPGHGRSGHPGLRRGRRGRADAQTAWDTLTHIDQLGHQHLRQRAITLIGILRDHAPSDLRTITEGFRTQTAAVFKLPDDQTLALPGPIRHDAISHPTRDAWLALVVRWVNMKSTRSGWGETPGPVRAL